MIKFTKLQVIRTGDNYYLQKLISPYALKNIIKWKHQN